MKVDLTRVLSSYQQGLLKQAAPMLALRFGLAKADPGGAKALSDQVFRPAGERR